MTSTAISNLLCLPLAFQVVAVIGDGAITGGMAYEAMNHAGFLDKNMIVILNDNQQVRKPIVPAVYGKRSVLAGSCWYIPGQRKLYQCIGWRCRG